MTAPLASRISIFGGALLAAVREKPKCIARSEEVYRRVRGFLGHLLERRDVIENVNPAPVGRDDEIAKLLLHHVPGDRSVGQARRECSPARSVVKGVEQTVSRAGKEQ